MTFAHGEVVENPVARLFGTIDLLFIVRFILSLVAISLSYNLVCGEKESGTFRLILSNPVPRDSILLGKIASAFTTLLLPFLVATLASLLFLQLSGDRALSSGEGWLAVGLFFLVSVLYLAVFIHLGAFVSTLTTRSMTSMTILLAVWVALVAVVPQTAGLVADVIYPVESPESFLLRKSLVVEDLEQQRAQELQPYVAREDYNDLRKPIAEKYADRLQTIHSRMDETYEVERQTQRRVATAIAAVSPAALLTFSATAVAGTGIVHAEHFTSRLADFRQQVHDELFSSSYRDYFLTNPGAGNIGMTLRTSLIDLESLPVFSYKPPSTREILGFVWPYLLILVVFNVVLFLLTYLRFRRYDVR
jgi:ABC-type transport system involved in multi-copper enzyme maturation permease subunit